MNIPRNVTRAFQLASNLIKKLNIGSTSDTDAARKIISSNTEHPQISEQLLIADGGERRHGKPAPPEDILAAPANALDTEPHPQEVTQEISQILSATETIVTNLDNPQEYEIDPSDNGVEQLTALADAIEDGKITLDANSNKRTPDDPVRGIQQNAQEIREQHSPDARASLRLLESLESARLYNDEQFATTLVETTEQLDRYQQLSDRLNLTSSIQEPYRLGDTIAENVDANESAQMRQLSEIGHTLKTTASDLEDCQENYSQISSTINTVCETAATQTEWSTDTDNPDEAVVELTDMLDNESIWFVDESSSITGLAENVDAADVAQSKPAEEFLNTLQNTPNVDNNCIEDAIRDAVKAIDRTETVTKRLDGINSSAIIQLADRLLSNLETQTSTVAPHIQSRIQDIKQTAEQTSEVDPLTLYAGQQELRYYDRTLIPQLLDGTETDPNATEQNSIAQRITDMDNRRAEMRRSYPSEYPDCDHTIPIYFFDLAASLIEEADHLETHGKPKQAASMINATEQLLDWIEGLYETHSYFVLLKQLRG